MKGKTLYILYQFDMNKDELVSDGPYLKKEEAYNHMHGFLKKGICAWVVVYRQKTMFFWKAKNRYML